MRGWLRVWLLGVLVGVGFPSWGWAQTTGSSDSGTTQALVKRLNHIIVLHFQGRYQAALEQAQALLAAPEIEQQEVTFQSTLYKYLAFSSAALNQPKAARTYLNRSFELDSRVLLNDTRLASDFALAAIFRQSVDDILKWSTDLYNQGQYTEAARLLEALVRFKGALSPSALATASRYLVMARVALGQDEMAKEQLKKVMKNNPQVKLNEKDLSKRSRLIFSQAHTEVYGKRVIGAALRSLICPGWGQIYRGRPLWGYGLMAAGLTTLVETWRSIDRYQEARDAYQNAPPNADFDRLYGRYQEKARNATIWSLSLVGVWAYSILDAVLFDSAGGLTQAQPVRPALALQVTASRLAMVYHYPLRLLLLRN